MIKIFLDVLKHSFIFPKLTVYRDRIIDSLILYSLSLVIPIVGVVFSMFLMILYGKWGNPFFIFRAFYYDYYFADIIAWRWHAALYFLTLICCLIKEK